MNSPFLDGRKKIFENDVGFVIGKGWTVNCICIFI